MNNNYFQNINNNRAINSNAINNLPPISPSPSQKKNSIAPFDIPKNSKSPISRADPQNPFKKAVRPISSGRRNSINNNINPKD